MEEGGSLTIVATCLIETESRMDDIIFEELKGTGNMEIRLDRELAESRIYPAIHIPQSGTRNDDRLYHPEEMERVIEIRRSLTTLPIGACGAAGNSQNYSRFVTARGFTGEALGPDAAQFDDVYCPPACFRLQNVCRHKRF